MHTPNQPALTPVFSIHSPSPPQNTRSDPRPNWLCRFFNQLILNYLLASFVEKCHFEAMLLVLEFESPPPGARISTEARRPHDGASRPTLSPRPGVRTHSNEIYAQSRTDPRRAELCRPRAPSPPQDSQPHRPPNWVCHFITQLILNYLLASFVEKCNFSLVRGSPQ
jgi:hypothetical protein